MNVTIRPPRARLSGRVQLPGDKSISHRFAMLGAIAEGVTRITTSLPARIATAHSLASGCSASL